MGSRRWQKLTVLCVKQASNFNGGAILHTRFYFPACIFLKVRYKRTIFVVFELFKPI